MVTMALLDGYLLAWRKRWPRWRAALGEFIYGAAAYDMVAYAVRVRSSLESLFLLVTFGDLIGLPVLPPYYSLRLLPYVVPQIATWKRRLLRERDFTETDGLELLG